MIDLNGLHALLVDSGAEQWSLVLHQRIAQQLAELNHGDLPTWQKVVEELPVLENNRMCQMRFGNQSEMN